MSGKRIWWGGGKWWLCKNGYFYNGDGKLLHRAVYEAHHGRAIPAGHDIHHDDEDKANNAPGNLIAKPKGQHIADHLRGRPHSNPGPGVAALAAFWKQTPERDAVCVRCGSTFQTRALEGRERLFCSENCLERFRGNAFQPARRACAYCGGAYTATRRVQSFCSERCNWQHGEKLRATAVATPIACAHCGDVFRSKRSNAKFCGRPCALAFHSAHSKRRKASDAAAGIRPDG